MAARSNCWVLADECMTNHGDDSEWAVPERAAWREVRIGSSRFRVSSGPIGSRGTELQSVGFVITDKSLGGRIDADGALEHPSERCSMASDMGSAHDGRVGCGRFPGFDAIREIA